MGLLTRESVDLIDNAERATKNYALSLRSMVSSGSERQSREVPTYGTVIVEALQTLSQPQQQIIHQLWRQKDQPKLHERLRQEFGSDVFDPVTMLIDRLRGELGWEYRILISTMYTYLLSVERSLPLE